MRSYEIDATGSASPVAICNYLQEAAGNHARQLGVDITALQGDGYTWMLSRLHIRLTRLPAWRETVTLETWPAGVRGRLIAVRDFIMRDAAGQAWLHASSEWLYVDVATKRICRVPEVLATYVPAGRASALPPDAGRPPELETPAWSVSLPVRRSDQDLNDHVNNVHYVEWLLEPLPPESVAGRQVAELEILYRQGAVFGDTVISEAAPAGDNTLLHRIVRAQDRTLLALARTQWRSVG